MTDTFQQLTNNKMNRILMVLWSTALLVTVVASSALPIIDHPRYAFKYAVHDPLTKDNKAQWESRDGGVVKGAYSLVEPDGSLRVVEYSADDLHGFNAIVKKVGPSLHPTPIVTKIAPIAKLPTIPIAPIAPLNYGFGVAPLPLGVSKTASLGPWSLPWDSFTGSYGGWVPLTGPLLPLTGPYATIFSKKYINGKVHKWVTGPIPLQGKTLIIKKKH